MIVGGSVNLLKPAGMTSHDGVYALRKLSGIKRIGHTGTLDPMATGVLPLLVGNATRLMEYLDIDDKEYRCEMILGIETDTQDIWGNLLKDKRDLIKHIDKDDILNAFEPYIGEIFQTPPLVSAVRIKGKRLYEYARKGEQVEVKPRPITIHRLNVLTIDMDKGRITFEVKCSKGTYIRSICHEVGMSLGCGGAMSFLIRKMSGVFKLENSVTLEELQKDWESKLLPLDYPLQKLGGLSIQPNRVDWFSNGGYLRPNEVEIIRQPSFKDNSKHITKKEGLDRTFNVYCKDRFLGVMLYDYDKELFVADKVFSR